MSMEQDFVPETVETAKENHRTASPACRESGIRVIEHPNYEPFVKLVCGHCGSETYVKRTENLK